MTTYDAGHAQGFRLAIQLLRDDQRYRNWWTQMIPKHSEYSYWQHGRHQMADYLETITSKITDTEEDETNKHETASVPSRRAQDEPKAAESSEELLRSQGWATPAQRSALVAALENEQAAHAKTIDNFEGYAGDHRGYVRVVQAAQDWVNRITDPVSQWGDELDVELIAAVKAVVEGTEPADECEDTPNTLADADYQLQVLETEMADLGIPIPDGDTPVRAALDHIDRLTYTLDGLTWRAGIRHSQLEDLRKERLTFLRQLAQLQRNLADPDVIAAWTADEDDPGLLLGAIWNHLKSVVAERDQLRLELANVTEQREREQLRDAPPAWQSADDECEDAPNTVNACESAEDAARRYAGMLGQLEVELTDRGIPLDDGPVDGAGIRTALDHIDRLTKTLDGLTWRWSD